jgi:four helix bundle protein
MAYALPLRQPMMQITSFRELEVWQLAMQLVIDVYALSAQLPRDEFDLRRQIRRAAISIPSNVAEGWRRKSRPAYRNHVSIALGSTAELETELELTVRLGFLTNDAAQSCSTTLERVGVVGQIETPASTRWRLLAETPRPE